MDIKKIKRKMKKVIAVRKRKKRMMEKFKKIIDIRIKYEFWMRYEKINVKKNNSKWNKRMKEKERK